ncbi:MAG: hypothetical protein KGJ06_07710 [Pseudomonadota bacterium]|nr:hypothetical protein [Pseudomonadota bacterium]
MAESQKSTAQLQAEKEALLLSAKGEDLAAQYADIPDLKQRSHRDQLKKSEENSRAVQQR